ncbi:type IV secretory system conjugative DNA transfer family protein [Paludisphaera borealis]|uniref:Conjugal transfer protein TraG n=1 Tax=Paludisphaera borealis TaxID=1387353 RepID=A0A1U7CIA7_9BACT|nr:type IV secretory system conjugative DNA transfer family protein [Paludisphaera borealis]APW58638.1 Conjugal transfer protein TraG [Paludisphaera borealis]
MRFIRRWTARLCRAILITACGIAAHSLVILAAQNPAYMLLAAVGAAYQYRRRWRPDADTHGSACWADMATLARSGMLADEGLILGRTGATDPMSRWRALKGLLSPRLRSDMACCLFYHAFFTRRWGGSRMIRLQRMIHAATFAPAGKGKGVAVLIPNLLSYRGSVVVTDPKGELALKTSRHRRRKFGHRIVTLDPFRITGEASGSINPLALIDPQSDSFLDDCRDLANMLVVRQGTEHEPHWNDCAELVICAFIALTCAYEKDERLRNLQMVRKLVSSREAFANAVALMRQFDGCHGVIQRLGDQLSWFQDKELNSVLTHVQRHTNFLDSPAIQVITQSSSFDPRELRTGRVSVYLILPPERLVTLAPLMRMWLGTIIRVLSRGEASEKQPVLFLLDEAAHLGKMQIIEDAVTLMRGYGIRLWFFFQSIDQLNKCFGERAPTILENLDTQQHFGIASYEAAEELSKRLGDTTIVVSGSSDTQGGSHPTGNGAHGQSPGSCSWSSTVNHSLTARRLAFANELITAGDDFQLILTRNLPPIAGRLLRYYQAPEFRMGGTGRQGRLGVAGLAAASLLLAASLCLASFSAALAPALRPEGMNRPAATRAFDGSPNGFGESLRVPFSRPSPYRPPSNDSRRFGGVGGRTGFPR